MRTKNRAKYDHANQSLTLALKCIPASEGLCNFLDEGTRLKPIQRKLTHQILTGTPQRVRNSELKRFHISLIREQLKKGKARRKAIASDLEMIDNHKIDLSERKEAAERLLRLIARIQNAANQKCTFGLF